MLFRLGRRAVFSGVVFFALLGFVSVPLGEKTGWRHLQAIAETPAASQALADLKTGIGQWQHRLVGWLTSTLQSRIGTDASPAEPAPAGTIGISVPQTPQRKIQNGSMPIPQPPRLSH